MRVSQNRDCLLSMLVCTSINTVLPSAFSRWASCSAGRISPVFFDGDAHSTHAFGYLGVIAMHIGNAVAFAYHGSVQAQLADAL